MSAVMQHVAAGIAGAAQAAQRAGRFQLPASDQVEGPFSPLIARELVRQRLRRRTMQFGEGGLRMRCYECGEFLPFDTRHFYPCAGFDGGLHSSCRTCCVARARARGGRS